MEYGSKSSRWVAHLHFALLCGSLQQLVPSVALEQKETYIIHMDPAQKPSPFSTHESWHQVILNSLSSSTITASSSAKSEKLIYSYNHALHGFSAWLTFMELKEIEKSPAHRATFRESCGKVLTTRSPIFLGLNHTSGLWPAASYGQDTIIGVLDTGVWPESKSFNDRKHGPIPSRWKGECERGASFKPSMCNHKLIGARSFSKGFKVRYRRNISKANDFDSPRDFDGHGTHTASIAAGSSVSDASYFDYARGIAIGVAPFAQLAIYKVAWFNNFVSSDLIAGFDKAIADGVDIITSSLSLGLKAYIDDSMAISALKAVNKGIFVVCSAGNMGRKNSTHNGAPWIMTVGAGTIDRNFLARLILGRDDIIIKGTSYYPGTLRITYFPLYYEKNDQERAQCLRSSLQPAQVNGKVLLCDLMSNQSDIFGSIEEVKRTGAKAAIFLMNTNKMILSSSDYYVPIVVITNNVDAQSVLHYAMTQRELIVKELLFGLTDEGIKPAPQVARFSSRGPCPFTPTILKPDILAPGKDILGAWVPNRPFITIDGKKMTTDYALVSGTSMAAPHIAGVAALLKSVHHDWTPAAIRSAIMTTARKVDNNFLTITDEKTNLPATSFDFGAGLVDPNAATDPGLIYDMEFKDYGEFLCTLGYTKFQMEIFTGRSEWNCNASSADLNYPSFMAVFNSTVTVGSRMVKSFRRVMTNVGDNKANYNAFVVHDPYMTMLVQPRTLNFTEKNQKLGFTLTVELNLKAWNSSLHLVANGVLHWVDDSAIHMVSSPVVAIIV